MPSAQGHLTVRRRPKDGNPGADAVRYWLVPSATQIKKTVDGKYNPTSVSCRKMKASGNSSPVETTEGVLQYQISYEDGSASALTAYSSAVTVPVKCVSIRFVLKIGNADVATETVSVLGDGKGITSIKSYYVVSQNSTGIKVDNVTWKEEMQTPTSTNKYLWTYEKTTYTDGTFTNTIPHIIGVHGGDGSDSCYLDLDNEVEAIPCDASGNPTISGTLASCNAKVYKGGSEDTGWTISAETDGGSTAGASGSKVSVTAISADRSSITVSAKKNDVTLSAVMTVYKAKAGKTGDPGNPGTSPVIYSIEVSTSAISRNSSGTLTPSTLEAWKRKTVGNSTSHTKEMVLKYQREGQDSDESTFADTNMDGNALTSFSTACTAVILTLYDGSTILDRERIPIVSDGQKGDPGSPGQAGADAISFVVSGDSVVFLQDAGLQTAYVRIKVFEGATQIKGTTEVGYSTLPKDDNSGGTGTITTGLLWDFLTLDEDFAYRLRFAGVNGNNVTRDIPFTVTYKGNAYHGNIHVCTVANGTQGIPGKAYQPIRCRDWSDIAVGSALTTGIGDTDQWTDVVYQMDSSVASGVVYWKCVKDFTKQSGQTPPKDSDTTSTNALVGYLQKSSGNFGMLATDILLTNYILVKNLGVETIEMRDAAGNLMFQAKNGVVTCNTGTFKNINVSGDSTLKDVTVSGNITANRMAFGLTSLGARKKAALYVNVSNVQLWALDEDTCEIVRIFNPMTTRSGADNLTLKGVDGTVLVTDDGSFFESESSKTISGAGLNAGMWLELIGYNSDGEKTYWTVIQKKSLYS